MIELSSQYGGDIPIGLKVADETEKIKALGIYCCCCCDFCCCCSAASGI
ncbi:MAG: hypothetical protein ACP5NL_07785 [Thermoplasmata archaeon]